jgi:hypothetical protein
MYFEVFPHVAQTLMKGPEKQKGPSFLGKTGLFIGETGRGEEI